MRYPMFSGGEKNLCFFYCLIGNHVPPIQPTWIVFDVL